MTLLIILFVIISILLIGSIFLNIKLFKAGVKHMEIAESYHNYFESTMDDVVVFSDFVDELVNHRRILADDPDVRNFHKGLKDIHNILMGYINVGKEINTKKKKEKGKEEEQ